MLMFDKSKNDMDEKQNEEHFVWRKKNQKTGIDKLEPAQLLMLNKVKRAERIEELEKLEKRRIDREREREERDRERVRQTPIDQQIYVPNVN